MDVVAIWILLGFVFIIILLALIPAGIAEKKGYSYGGFWLFGLFFFLPALVTALLLHDRYLDDQRFEDTAADRQFIADKQLEAAAEQQLLTYKQLYDAGGISREDYLQKLKETGGLAPDLARSMLRAEATAYRNPRANAAPATPSMPVSSTSAQSSVHDALTRYCPQCGQPVTGNAVFCGHCGSHLPSSSGR